MESSDNNVADGIMLLIFDSRNYHVSYLNQRDYVVINMEIGVLPNRKF